jgi:hypothetical protein
MQEALYPVIQEILETLKAVTAELQRQHAGAGAGASNKPCPEQCCLALGRAEAEAESLRRKLGLPSVRFNR